MTTSLEAILIDAPLVCWANEETSGTTAADASGNGRTGTMFGNPVVGTAGIAPGSTYSIDFDGSGDSIFRIHEAWMNVSTITVEDRVHLEGAPGSNGRHTVVAKEDYTTGGATRGWSLHVLTDGTPVWTGYLTSGSIFTAQGSPGQVPLNTTKHLAGTYDGTTAILLVEGVQVASHAISGSLRTNTYALQVGKDSSGNNRSMNGRSDEFAMWGSALTPQQILSHALGSPRAAIADDADSDDLVTAQVSAGFYLTAIADDADSDDLVTAQVVIGTATKNLIGGRDREGQALATWEPPIVEPPATTTLVYDYISTQAWEAVSLPAAGVGPMHLVGFGESEKPRTRTRILVAGRDLSFWRGRATPEPSYSLMEPLLYGSGSLELSQVVVPFELPGGTGLEWMKPGAPVIIQSVDTATNTVVSTDYRGFLLDLDISGRTLRWGLAGEVSGRAALQWHPQPLFKRRNDLGFWWSTAVTKAGGRFAPRGGPNTGIELYAFGNTQRLDHMMELSAKGVNGNGAQWTCMPDANGVYRVTRKDRTTIHATAYIDDAHTVANLRRDPAEEPNAVWGTYVTPSGMRVKNGVYPVLADTKAPAFPGVLEEGDTGDGVTALIVRLAATGKLSYDDRPGGFDAEVTEAVKDVQDDADLPKTGIVNAATWAYLFDTPVNGYDIGGSHIEPLVQRAYRRRYKRTSGGNVSGDHPLHDRTRLPVDRFVDFGTNRKRREVMPWAKELLAPDDANNWAGTIVFNTHALIAGEHNPGDPLDVGDVMAAKDLKPGMNIWLPTWDGGTLVHVSGVSVTDRLATATVDTQARDAMAVWEVLARNAENRRDPGRAWIRRHRSSGLTKDAVDQYDEVGGIISDRPLEAGWNVVPVVAGQSGTIGRLRLKLTPAKEFAGAVFGKEVTRGYLAATVAMPLTKAGGKRWTNEDVQDNLDREKVVLYTAGDIEGPAGYSPLMKDSETEAGTPAPLTGRLDDDAGFEYRTFRAPQEMGADSMPTYVLYIAIWVDSATTLTGGRVMWPLLESGA